MIYERLLEYKQELLGPFNDFDRLRPWSHHYVVFIIFSDNVNDIHRDTIDQILRTP